MYNMEKRQSAQSIRGILYFFELTLVGCYCFMFFFGILLKSLEFIKKKTESKELKGKIIM